MDSATKEIKVQIMAEIKPQIARAAKEIAQKHVEFMAAVQQCTDRDRFTRRNESDIWDGFTTASLDDGNPNISYRFDNEFGAAKVFEILVEGGGGEVDNKFIREEVEIRLRDLGAVTVKFSMSHTITHQ